MKKKNSLIQTAVAIAVSLALSVATASAQHTSGPERITAPVKTDSRMIYHNGPVTRGRSNVYFIWYGCWTNNCGISGDTQTLFILTDFISSLGSTPYFQINSTYPDSTGQAPDGGLIYGGAAVDQTYSDGLEFAESDIQGIIADQITGSQLPLDPSGIYIVLASADVSSAATGFCAPSAPPHHGFGVVLGTRFLYGFVGNAVRCPSIGAAQFIAPDGSRLPTPNGNLGADAMAASIAHVLNTIVTNPFDGA